MQQLFNRNLLTLIIFAFICIVSMQWAHFVFYFKQETLRSFIWSFTDWSVWFVLFLGYTALLYKLTLSDKNSKNLTIPFVLLAGIFQISICSLIYMLMFDSTNTFTESVAKSFNKRWLQNLFIAGIFTFVARTIIQKLAFTKNEANLQTSLQEIPLFDGKNHYLVKTDDIIAICSDKNYLSVFTKQQEIIIRSTLKSMMEQIEDNSFIQLSRSAFANKKAITGLNKYSRTSFKVQLGEQKEINVSKQYLPNIQALLVS